MALCSSPTSDPGGGVGGQDEWGGQGRAGNRRFCVICVWFSEGHSGDSDPIVAVRSLGGDWEGQGE